MTKAKPKRKPKPAATWTAADVDTPRELTTRIAAHVSLVSFTDDHLAAEFREWWQSRGERAFLNWANQREADRPRERPPYS